VRYLLRRLGFFVLTLWAALTVNFFIPRFMPGSPLQALRDRTHNKLSPAALEQMLTAFGYKPHQGLFQQYVDYLGNMLTGRWGVSIGQTLGEPVSHIVGQALPWTLGLVGVATILAFVDLPPVIETWITRTLFLVMLGSYTASSVLDWRDERRQVRLLLQEQQAESEALEHAVREAS